MPCKVLVVDDSVIMRSIVKDIMSSDPAFKVVGEAQDGRWDWTKRSSCSLI